MLAADKSLAQGDVWRGRLAKPLSSASEGGWLGVVDSLLDPALAVDLEACDERGFTALHAAASKTKVDVVRALLDAGASVKAKDLSGRTPLHVASETGDFATCQALVTSGGAGPLGLRDCQGLSAADVASGTVRAYLQAPLHVECSRGSLKGVLALLKNNPEIKSDRHTKEEATAAASSKFGPNDRDSNGLTPLLLAAWMGHVAVCQALLERGAAVNGSDSYGSVDRYYSSLSSLFLPLCLPSTNATSSLIQVTRLSTEPSTLPALLPASPRRSC